MIILSLKNNIFYVISLGNPKDCPTIQSPAEAHREANPVAFPVHGQFKVAEGTLLGRNTKGSPAAGGTGGFGEL